MIVPEGIKYAKASKIVLAALLKAKNKGVILQDLVRTIDYTDGTISHALQVLAGLGLCKSKNASSKGDRCTNRRRYWAATFAPSDARCSSRDKKPVEDVPMQPGHFTAVCAPSEALPCGFPPYWWADRLPGRFARAEA